MIFTPVCRDYGSLGNRNALKIRDLFSRLTFKKWLK